MIRSKIWLAAAMTAAALAQSAVTAQSNLKIGVVNVARLIEQSPQSESVTKKLQDEFGPRQRDITAMQQRLRTQQETFQRDAPVMAEAERLNLERQIRDAQRELQRTENEYLEDLNLRRNEELGNLQREVLMKAQEYARAQRFDLLIADANVIFASTAVDVTEAVLGVLNPAGGAQAPAAPAPSSSGGQQRNPSPRRNN
jgi:outer membrane protein